MARLLSLLLFAFAGCGDGGGSLPDGSLSDSGTDSNVPRDTGGDAGGGSSLTVTVISGPLGSAVPIEGARVWLESADDLLEETAGRDGKVTFPGVDIDAESVTLTAFDPEHIAVTYVGFDREVIRYHEDRGWPVSADVAAMVISLERVATVELSGSVVNADTSLATIFVEPLDGDALQYRGFSTFPWTVRMSAQTSTTLIAWVWGLGPAGFGERGRTWTADATYLETSAVADAGGLVLDFAGDVPLGERTIAYVVPSGTPFFESALPLAVLSTVTPRGGIGAIVGFPLETIYDEATGIVSARLGVVNPPAGEASFLTLQLEGSGNGQSNVVLDWDGPPSAPIDAEFLSPPTLVASTADGIRLGQRVLWASPEVDTIQQVVYSIDTAPRWSVQYWGISRARGDFPDLPASALEGMLGPGALTAHVASCEFTPGLCRRLATTRAFDVER